MTDTATATEQTSVVVLGAGPSAFTSVQHLEINPARFEFQTKCQRLLHAPFEAERMAIFDALAYDPEDRFEDRALKICRCCRFPAIYVDEAGTPTTSLQRCRDRLCPLCSAARARESGRRVKAIVQLMDAPRFLTLTVPESCQALGEQLSRLMEQFRTLRAEPAWKRYVKGGVWSLELTFNRETRKWHPHIHVIMDGTYFPQPEIKAIWSGIQGQDSIVDVRAVSSVGAAAHYIAKYVSKTVDLESWEAEQITEYASAMHRRRTIHTFGSCHGRTAEADPNDEPKSTATRTVSFSVIRRRIRLGDEMARRAALTLCSVGGVFRKLLDGSIQHHGYLEGEHLKTAMQETAEWLLGLDPQTAGCWKPQPPPGPPRRPTPPPDPRLTDPPWDERDAWNER